MQDRDEIGKLDGVMVDLLEEGALDVDVEDEQLILREQYAPGVEEIMPGPTYGITLNDVLAIKTLHGVKAEEVEDEQQEGDDKVEQGQRLKLKQNPMAMLKKTCKRKRKMS